MSGVLAAVTAGIYLGWQAPRVSTAQMRMEGVAVWSFIVSSCSTPCCSC